MTLALRPPLFILVFAIGLALLPPIGKRAPAVEGARSNAPGDKPVFPRPNWNLRYKSGSYPLKKDRWLKGAFVDGLGGEEGNPVVVIERDQVQAIYFNLAAQKDSDAVE